MEMVSSHMAARYLFPIDIVKNGFEPKFEPKKASGQARPRQARRTAGLTTCSRSPRVHASSVAMAMRSMLEPASGVL